MGTVKTYFNMRGKHQKKLEKLLKLLPTFRQPCNNPKTTNKHLENFRINWNFYNFLYCDSNDYKDYTLIIENDLDILITKAFNEQFKKGE